MTRSDSSERRSQFKIERRYKGATLDEVWALWTTSSGVESWWGPEGFQVVVTAMDLKPGGELVYTMTATAPEQIAFMQQAGMPISTECRLTYTTVSAPHRLGYSTSADFIPGVEPYEVGTLVELMEIEGGVKLEITFDAMHDDVWTERARAGHESQTRKLDGLLSARRAGLDQ
jgi:uncharacterized protein YndB with AHSA1/START domain